MYKENSENYLVIINVERRYSHKNSEYYWLIEFVRDWPAQYFRTYVSQKNDNYDRWRDIIRNWTGQEAIAIRGDFRSKKSDQTLINADCDFQITACIARQPFLDLIYQELRD